MQIKKFTASNYAEALGLAKRELGEDALILSARTLGEGKGFREYKGYKQVEVTAAIDPSARKDEERAEETSVAVAERPFRTAGEFPMGSEADDLNLRPLVMTLLSQTDRARSLGLKGRQLELYQKLLESGVNERLAVKIFEKINSENDSGGAGDNPARNKKAVTELMERLLLCKGEIEMERKAPKMVALVGPTGAGKTTTIAKLAARFTLEGKKKVALVSLDTYRIGAVDQLKVYGEIMRLPVEAASGPKDFREIVRKHSDKDLILIDTAGRCHRDHAHSGRLKEIFKAGEKIETHLVLNVTSQEKIFEETFKQFSLLNIDRVLFTKLDEGVNFGPLFNFSLSTRIPFSYFTTGQRVPEDIETANRDKVIRLIFN